MENESKIYATTYGSTFSLTKVFSWMFVALLITAATAIGLPYLLVGLGLESFYYPMMIVSSILSIVLIFMMSFKAFSKSGSKSIGTCFIIYSISMGVMLSSFTLLYDLEVLGFAFLVASLCFGVMAAYGFITKRNTFGLGMFGMTFLFGGLILTLVNFFIQSEAIYWVVSYITLAAMLAITAYDINYSKKIAESGMGNHNLAVYMAFQLYTDFIYIFIRLVAIFARNKD